MSHSLDKNQPRLCFPDKDGNLLQEHLPTQPYWFALWFDRKWRRTLEHYDKDVYYWHFQADLDVIFQKQLDIEFMLHVLKDHDGTAPDLKENKRYAYLQNQYGPELTYVLVQLGLDGGKPWQNHEFGNTHPYVYAYKERWFPKHTDPQFKLLYHGIKAAEGRTLLLARLKSIERRIRAFEKKYHLHTTTLENTNDI
ncbi:MAG: hypothetical protein WAQ24_05145 [Candidatus Saccharimonadales bacterium]